MWKLWIKTGKNRKVFHIHWKELWISKVKSDFFVEKHVDKSKKAMPCRRKEKEETPDKDMENKKGAKKKTMSGGRSRHGFLYRKGEFMFDPSR